MSLGLIADNNLSSVDESLIEWTIVAIELENRIATSTPRLGPVFVADCFEIGSMRIGDNPSIDPLTTDDEMPYLTGLNFRRIQWEWGCVPPNRGTNQ